MGPYLVLDNSLGWVLKIQKDPDSKIKLIHINDVKKYTGHTSRLPWVKFHGSPEKEIQEAQEGAALSEGGTEGPDLNSKDPEGKEFKKGGTSTPEVGNEGPSLQGDEGAQGSDLIEIDDQYMDAEPEEDGELLINKDPLDKKDPNSREGKKEKTPDLSESKQYRRGLRERRSPLIDWGINKTFWTQILVVKN